MQEPAVSMEVLFLQFLKQFRKQKSRNQVTPENKQDIGTWSSLYSLGLCRVFVYVFVHQTYPVWGNSRFSLFPYSLPIGKFPVLFGIAFTFFTLSSPLTHNSCVVFFYAIILQYRCMVI